ncbi:hypothetical protein VTK73DRAFT_742 [Phialemonium thermophilum]|uniref:Uncharacterized protein n=1 Tax=Phialemonium thermophilum TaxID=223376 RepID=A0ABR3VUC1_9PEZI
MRPKALRVDGGKKSLPAVQGVSASSEGRRSLSIWAMDCRDRMPRTITPPTRFRPSTTSATLASGVNSGTSRRGRGGYWISWALRSFSNEMWTSSCRTVGGAMLWFLAAGALVSTGCSTSGCVAEGDMVAGSGKSKRGGHEVHPRFALLGLSLWLSNLPVLLLAWIGARLLG